MDNILAAVVCNTINLLIITSKQLQIDLKLFK
jgi:hypothetical protein